MTTKRMFYPLALLFACQQPADKKEEQGLEARITEAGKQRVRSHYLKENGECQQISSYLSIPEYSTCIDNDSREHIVILYDQNHDDLEYQAWLEKEAQDLYENEEITLIAREGGLGRECGAEEYETEVNEDYFLPELQRTGATVIELHTPVEDFATKITLGELGAYLYKLKTDSSTSGYKNTYDEREEQILKSSLTTYNDLRAKIAPATSDDVNFHFRSYAAVDALLDLMTVRNQERAVLIYGTAHMLQIEGYLDYLQVSHTSIALDADLYAWRREELDMNYETHFSLEQLYSYQALNAQGVFDVCKREEPR